MVSDQEIGKKEIEKTELESFLEAREFVTGEMILEIIGLSTESPDFICVKKTGELVGIELTKIKVNYEQAFWDKRLHGEIHIDPYNINVTIQHLIEQKEKKRKKLFTKKVKETILVLQLMDGSLDQLAYFFEGLDKIFSLHGFLEVWLADYSGLDAFGDIELFGFFPLKFWGYHSRPNPDRKPYG